MPEKEQRSVTLPRQRGRPSQSEALALDLRIVEAALSCFLEIGFEATTIEQVAAAARTTRRSVTHRFASKDQLLTAAARQMLANMHDNVLAKLDFESSESLEALRDGCRILLEDQLRSERIAFFRIISSQATRNPELSKLVIGMSDEIERSFARLILNAQNSGHFERLGAGALARAVIGLFVSNPLNRATLGDSSMSDPDGLALYFSEAWSVFRSIT